VLATVANMTFFVTGDSFSHMVSRCSGSGSSPVVGVTFLVAQVLNYSAFTWISIFLFSCILVRHTLLLFSSTHSLVSGDVLFVRRERRDYLNSTYDLIISWCRRMYRFVRS